MDIRLMIAAGEDTEDEIRSLFRDVRDEQIEGLSVRLLGREIAPADLGGITDTILMGLASSGASAALASVIREWLRQRHNEIEFTITKENGSTVHFRASGGGSPDKALEQLEDFLKGEPK